MVVVNTKGFGLRIKNRGRDDHRHRISANRERRLQLPKLRSQGLVPVYAHCNEEGTRSEGGERRRGR